MHLKLLRLLPILLVLVLAAAANTFGLTTEQLQMLQQLSPQERQALTQQFGGDQVVTQPPLYSPQLVLPPGSGGTALPLTAAEAGDPRAGGGDTLILSITRPSAPPGTKESELPSYLDELMGSKVYRLDTEGRLILNNIGSIPVAGLSEKEIAARLSAEPMLKGLAIKAVLLPLEPTGTSAIEPFGYDLFKGIPTTFMPAMDIPIPADYVLGPGDTIILQLFGKENARYSLVVTREGTVQIPKIGPVSAAGQKFGDLIKQWKK